MIEEMTDWEPMKKLKARGNLKDIVLYENKRTTNHETVLNTAWAAVKNYIFASKCGRKRPDIATVKAYVRKHMALAEKITKNKKLKRLFKVFENPDNYVIEQGIFRKKEYQIQAA